MIKMLLFQVFRIKKYSLIVRISCFGVKKLWFGGEIFSEPTLEQF